MDLITGITTRSSPCVRSSGGQSSPGPPSGLKRCNRSWVVEDIHATNTQRRPWWIKLWRAFMCVFQ